MSKEVAGLMILGIALLCVVFCYAVQWVVFSKAGRPGWASLIPIYNWIVAFDMVGMSAINFFLLLVPLLNIFVAAKFSMKLAQAFGKGGGFAVGLFLLGPIFWAILAFGDAAYELEDDDE